MTLTGWSGYCCACAVTDASGNVRAKNESNRSIYVSSEPAYDRLSKENITSASAAKRHSTARESVLSRRDGQSAQRCYRLLCRRRRIFILLSAFRWRGEASPS